MQENIQQSSSTSSTKLTWMVVLLTVGLTAMVVILILTQKKPVDTSSKISITPPISTPTITLTPTLPVSQEVVEGKVITIDTAPTFTGVAESSVETIIPKADDQAIQLRQLLPIETDQITVTYDYENDQFIFTLKAKAHKFDARSWLDERSYFAIPLDQVRIE